MREIVEQADGIEAGSFQHDSHFVIVAVHILALSLVAAQGMPRGKSLVNADLKHRFPFKECMRENPELIRRHNHANSISA